VAAFEELKGRVAVVTGAAQGIGRATATTLAAHGMAVVVVDLNDARGGMVVREIEQAGGRATYVHADVGTAAGCHAMVDTAVQGFGGVYALVNNARWHPHVPLTEIVESDWDRSQAVLLKSHYLASKYAIPHMIAGGGGAIVGISSVHAIQVTDNEASYEAAKAGINALMRSIACAYGPQNIRANAIMPGGIVTDVKQSAWETNLEQQALTRLQNPIGRPGFAQDIANAVLFLVSDLASFVTGESLVVDGGMSIQLAGVATHKALAWERAGRPGA